MKNIFHVEYAILHLSNLDNRDKNICYMYKFAIFILKFENKYPKKCASNKILKILNCSTLVKDPFF